MITQAGQVVVQLADNIMVGRLGAAPLAGVSFANAIIMIGMVFAIGFTQGLTPMVGQNYGKGDGLSVARLFFNSTIMNIAMSILLTATMFAIGLCMDRMGQDPEVLVHAKGYYHIIVAGFIPMILFFHIRFFSEGLGNTRNAMWITIVANLLNVFLNWVLIYGKLGAPRLEAAGAAWATFAARVLSLFLFTFLLFKSDEYRKYLKLIPKKPFSRTDITSIFKVSLPISLQNLMEVTAFSFAAIMVGWMGTYELAAHQIANSLSHLSFMLATGIGAAATIRVAHQFGAGLPHDAFMAGKASVHMAMAIMIFFGIIFIALHKWIPYIYTSDEIVAEIAGKIIIVMALFQIFDAIQLSSRSSLIGIKDINIPLIFSGISYYAICLPSAYLLGFVLDLGPIGVWSGLLLGLAAAAVLFYTRFVKICKHHIKAQNIKTPEKPD